MNLLSNVDFAKKAEGTVKLPNGNHKLYKCPADKWTIGYGYNIQDNGLPDDIAETLVYEHISASHEACMRNFDFYMTLDEPRKRVLVDMCYNMGIYRLLGFKKMLTALSNNDFNEAADEMIDSRWFRQTGRRSKHLVEVMRCGEWNSEL